MNISEAVIYLVSCAVDEKIPEKAVVNEMDLKQVYSFASEHMLSAAVAMALEDAGFRDERSSRVISAALRKISVLETEKNMVLQKLEEAKIWYMLLKGAIMKDFYPRAGMREMSDYDILFDAPRAEDVKTIMESLGFFTSAFDFGFHNEDGYYKKPVTLFEMHRSLFGARHGKIICDYYKDIKNRLIRDDNTQYSFHFTPEDFYIYLVAHEYSHYSAGGTGLRSLLDVYVFLKNHELDWLYIESEISKLEMSDFEKANHQLALNLFTRKALTDKEKKMLDYILASGTYGSTMSMQLNAGQKIAEYGRLKYFMKRLTLPYSQMLEEYPVLKKAPYLYPFYWLSRLLIRGLFFRRKQLIAQLKALLNLE